MVASQLVVSSFSSSRLLFLHFSMLFLDMKKIKMKARTEHKMCVDFRALVARLNASWWFELISCFCDIFNRKIGHDRDMNINSENRNSREFHTSWFLSKVKSKTNFLHVPELCLMAILIMHTVLHIQQKSVSHACNRI